MASIVINLEVDGEIYTAAGEYVDPAQAFMQVLWMYDAAREARNG